MNKRIAVAGTGYVGLSIATLLAQKNEVEAVDVIPQKVELINQKLSPIQDDYIEEYLREKPLHLHATTDGENAYKNAECWKLFGTIVEQGPETAIEISTDNYQLSTKKLLHDGQLLIEKNGNTYTVQGQLVK